MKKFVYFLCWTVFFALGLTACGTDRAAGDQIQEESGEEQIQEEGEEEQIQEERGAEPGGTEEAETDLSGLRRIEDQSFQVNLRPLGEVTFGSYEPDTQKDPLADVVLTIEQEGKVLQRLPGEQEENGHRNDAFYQVEAVSFLDYNQDNWDDIIVICSYCIGAGPEAGQTYSEIRYYKGSGSGAFTYEAQMSQEATSALAEITIETAKGFIGAEKSDGTEKEPEPWQRFYLGYLENSSEVEMQEGYALIYLDDDEIPELVEVGDCEATGCRIICYADEMVHTAQLNRLYFSYIERGNLLCNSEGNMDSYYDLVYSIIDGELTLIASGFYGAEDNSNVQFDAFGEPIYQYEWNGTKMSKEEYGKALNQVYDMSRAEDGYGWDQLYSYEEIKDVIENYGEAR